MKVTAALAGMLTAAAVGTGAHALAAPAGPVTVQVYAHYSQFVPDRIRVHVGQTVRFVVHNTDPIDHEFLIGTLAEQLRHEHGTQRTHHAPGQVSLPAQSVEVTTFTFHHLGTLLFGCHEPGHWRYGMRGQIDVLP